MSTIFSRLQNYPRALLYILAIGLVLRTLFISLHQRPLISDEKEYARLAYSLVYDGTYAYDGTPTAYRPVGYPAFVAAVYLFTGHHPLAVKFLQGLLDSLTALIIFHLLTEFTERIRILGAALWAFYPPAILYVNFLLSESVFTFFLVLSACLLARSKLEHWTSRILLGILLGVLLLMKPSFLLFLILLLLVSRKLDIPLKRLSLPAVGVLIVVSPWILRNVMVLGDLTLSSNGGINLLIGNNPNATGAYTISWPPEVLQGATDESEANRRAFDYAIRYIGSNPGAFAVNGVKKIAHLFESEGGVLVWSFHEKPEDTSTRYASKYASLSFLLILLVNLPYAVILMTGLLGFLVLPRDRLWWFTAALLTSWLITHFIFFGGGRFHFPLMPFVAIFAARFMPEMRSTLRQISRGRALAGALVVAGLLAVWISELVIILNA